MAKRTVESKPTLPAPDGDMSPLLAPRSASRRTIGKLEPLAAKHETRQGRYADGGGLYLVVTRSGTKSWAFRYARQGRQHEMGLGSVDTIGLADARKRARRCREQLLDGLDPLTERRAVRGPGDAGETFAAVAEHYVVAHAPAWRSEIHARQWRNSLRDYVLPAIGAEPVAAIDTDAVMRILGPLWPAKTETASRLRQRIEAVLDYAAARGWRRGDNPARWRGHLANLLPARARVAPVQHHAAMAWRELPKFIERLASSPGMAAAALRFTILSAARSAEARGARWREIDFLHLTWTVPADRMKAHREHRVPLAPAAIALLREMQADGVPSPDDLVFPGGRRRGVDQAQPLSDVALNKAVPKGLTVHGFRSTFRDWAAETTGHPREVIEMALAHRLGDSVEQAYARGDLFDKRRNLMEDWSVYCTKPAPAVVPLRGAERARRT